MPDMNLHNFLMENSTAQYNQQNCKCHSTASANGKSREQCGSQGSEKGEGHEEHYPGVQQECVVPFYPWITNDSEQRFPMESGKEKGQEEEQVQDQDERSQPESKDPRYDQ